MSYDNNNIFAKILNDEIPCKKVFENEHVLAFEDINPQAPIHILVIPKNPYVSAVDFAHTGNEKDIVSLMKAVGEIAQQLNIEKEGFRIVSNVGENGGQEVPHLHLHILAGEKIGPIRAK